MRLWMIAPLVTGLLLSMLPADADARRFGGSRSFGMQRTAPAKPAPTTPAQNAPAQNAQAAPTSAAATPAAAGAAAAAAPRRSWMGPVAGLAAGLGLAALASHLGFGEGLANFMMLALLAVVGVVAVRFLLRRFAGGGGPRPAFAGMAGGAADGPVAARAALPSARIGSALATPLALDGGETAAALPADFDRDGFERIAKMIFIRMQTANDSADLNDLRSFTTPELFADVRLELQERGPAAQQTDVEQVDAEVVDFAQEDERQIVSVRFRGRVREQAGAEAVAFDEVWHLVKPTDDSRNWAIAGIQQQ